MEQVVGHGGRRLTKPETAFHGESASRKYAVEGAVDVALAKDCRNTGDWPWEGNVDMASVWALSWADRLAMDTIVDVVVGSVGEEGRVAGRHDSIEHGVAGAEDDRLHAAFDRSEVEWLVLCSSRLGPYRLAAPDGRSRLFD